MTLVDMVAPCDSSPAMAAATAAIGASRLGIKAGAALRVQKGLRNGKQGWQQLGVYPTSRCCHSHTGDEGQVRVLCAFRWRYTLQMVVAEQGWNLERLLKH